MDEREGVVGLTAHVSDDGWNREESVAEHTEKTVFLCGKKGERCGLPKLMALCGMFHDMGKNKQKFDDYIHAEERTRKRLRGTIAHASTGAKYIYEKYHEEPGNIAYMAEMVCYAIAAHHGLFDCVDIEHTDLFSKKLDKVEDYEEACHNAKQEYLDGYQEDKVFAEAAEEFRSVWNKIKEPFARLKPLMIAKYGQEAREMLAGYKLFMLGCLQRLILSILVDADWEATSDFMDDVDTLSKGEVFHKEEIFREAQGNFKEYMRKKQEAIDLSKLTDKERGILDARNALQRECREFVKYPAGIYCLPIPTGGGKTLASLAYALEYCRLHPETERIIYVSPYISITEQNAQVFREAVGDGRWILEHHSSVVRNEGGEGEDYRAGKFSRYDMNWEEPFICTTFVQFMNTLFSDRSESIRRMHRLANSVVIIDEVQSMPLKCIHTFNYMINFLNAVCHTNVVLCTATQPTLEEAECPICYSEPKYMIEDVAGWFDQFERVKICVPRAGQKYTFESLGKEIVGQTEKYRSILVVLNTKSAVRKLYDLLKERNVKVEYLTTNLCAEHRSDKIKSIKEILGKKQENIVVVSTNLIEAGVDLSFECVYRSMAGLDSLAQTAGRCNRNGEMEYGTITLIELEGENIGNMEELHRSIKVTEGLVGQYNGSEGGGSLLTPEWMDKYYRYIYSEASDQMNFSIKKWDTNMLELLSRGFGPEVKRNAMNQAYKTAGQAYRVIDDHSFGVIVPYKEGAEIIASIQEADNVMDIKGYIRKAQRYTVNIRESQLKKLEGLIQPVSDQMPDLYMIAAPGGYHMDYGIAPEWETLIF